MWVPVSYPNAIWDDDEHRLISDAEVAETTHTAFTSRRKAEHITGRLTVRRVRRLNTVSRDGAKQDELLAARRYPAVFTNSPRLMLAAEAAHCGHAIIEQVIAELKDGPLAHLPSGTFNANAAWLVLASNAFNLTRTAGTLASRLHAKARLAALRAQFNQSPRQARPLRPPPHPAPTSRLALATRMAATRPASPRRHQPRDPLTITYQPDQGPRGEPGAPGKSPAPTNNHKINKPAQCPAQKWGGGSRLNGELAALTNEVVYLDHHPLAVDIERHLVRWSRARPADACQWP